MAISKKKAIEHALELNLLEASAYEKLDNALIDRIEQDYDASPDRTIEFCLSDLPMFNGVKIAFSRVVYKVIHTYRELGWNADLRHNGGKWYLYLS